MAKISEFLAEGTTVSFEFPPPKTAEAVIAFDEAMDDLAGLNPTFVSVTYGALGTTRDTTRDVVIRVNKERDFPAMPHLTCVGHSRDELVALLTDYREAGVENILSLAGDPPADGSETRGEFTYATELIDVVAEVGDFGIGVAAFPEVHPRSADRADDRRRLAAKLNRADFGISQFFFDVDHYLVMRDELATLGCDRPVLAGVFPFVNLKGLRRMAGMNGTVIPPGLEAQLDRLEDDPEGVRALGVEVASELCTRLLAEGAPGIHLYTMNRAASARQVCLNTGLGLTASPTGHQENSP